MAGDAKDKATLLDFTREKETKNTVRYQEDGDGPHVIGTLYVQKWWAKEAQTLQMRIGRT